MIAPDERLRALVGAAAGALMEADLEDVAGAGYRVVSPARRVQRNGYRPRLWRTAIGPVELAIPRVRRGSYCPHWLFAAEAALVDAAALAERSGVSPAWVERLVAAVGLRLSPRQLGELADELRDEFANAREISARAS